MHVLAGCKAAVTERIKQASEQSFNTDVNTQQVILESKMHTSQYTSHIAHMGITKRYSSNV